ncbi:MAG: flagellar biosynthetic protein FliO [Lachnospiraceae bacterium]|nr:flagellar biosynthetic protein FliO [Lachnospiraceae bacterium]
MNVLMTSYSRLSSFAQLIALLIIFVFVLALTFYATRWMAKLQKSQYKNSNINVIETFRLSNTKYIQIIKLGEKYIAIAICKDTVTVLTELEENQLELMKNTEEMNVGFQEILKKVKNMKEVNKKK